MNRSIKLIVAIIVLQSNTSSATEWGKYQNDITRLGLGIQLGTCNNHMNLKSLSKFNTSYNNLFSSKLRSNLAPATLGSSFYFGINAQWLFYNIYWNRNIASKTLTANNYFGGTRQIDIANSSSELGLDILFIQTKMINFGLNIGAQTQNLKISSKYVYPSGQTSYIGGQDGSYSGIYENKSSSRDITGLRLDIKIPKFKYAQLTLRADYIGLYLKDDASTGYLNPSSDQFYKQVASTYNGAAYERFYLPEDASKINNYIQYYQGGYEDSHAVYGTFQGYRFSMATTINIINKKNK